MPTGALVWVPLVDACHDRAASGPAKKKTTLLSLVFYELLQAAKKETLTKETRRQEK